MPRRLAQRGATADLQRALQGLYDAVVSPETWPTALHGFARATNSVGCLLYPQHRAEALIHLPVSPDVQEFIAAFVKEGWHREDVRAARGWPLAAAGKLVLTDDDIATVEERKSSEFYQGFHRHWGLPNWAAITFAVSDKHWCVPLLRSDRQGPISKAQAKILAAISPHLSRAVELAKLLDGRRAREHLEILHRSGRAAALLDWRGNVSGLTPAAEALLGDDLQVRAGRLIARDLDSNTALQRLIAAATINEPSDAAINIVAVIERPHCRPVLVRSAVLDGALADAFGEARAILLFDDLEAKKRPAAKLLRNLFGLTPAESRLLIEMTSGIAVEAAAQKLAISTATARNQLKSAYHKAGVHKQTELLALLNRLPTE